MSVGVGSMVAMTIGDSMSDASLNALQDQFQMDWEYLLSTHDQWDNIADDYMNTIQETGGFEIEDQHVALDNQHVPLDDQHVALDDQHVPLDDQHVALDDQHVLLDDQHIALDDQHVPLDDQHVPLYDQHVPMADEPYPLVDYYGKSTGGYGSPFMIDPFMNRNYPYLREDGKDKYLTDTLTFAIDANGNTKSPSVLPDAEESINLDLLDNLRAAKSSPVSSFSSWKEACKEELQQSPLDVTRYLACLVDPNEMLPKVRNIEVRKETIKPYHPSLDHDYYRIAGEVEVKKEIVEDEPVVDVWKIESFNEEQDSSSVSEYLPASKKQTRHSERAAEIRRKKQAKRVSTAIMSVLEKKITVFDEKKQRCARQCKKRPHNSVETTPFQSDVEEWYCQPIKPTTTKITKKKTTKGRTDHSLSERHRREVLRIHFQLLSALIPPKFLKGDKPSSQISKQKILNGAKAYLLEVRRVKKLYKELYLKRKLIRERYPDTDTET